MTTNLTPDELATLQQKGAVHLPGRGVVVDSTLLATVLINTLPALMDEVDRLRAVADAAIAWRRMRAGTPTTPKPESAALIAAVDKLTEAGAQ